MDMKINHHLLRQEREQRAWTQSQLAAVAGLSMRTVQRIERNGIAAKESAMALASALELDVGTLLMVSEKPVGAKKYRHWWGLGAIFASLLISLGWWSTAAAEQVMIHLSVQTEAGDNKEMQLLNELGAPSEINLDQQFRLLVTASRQDQQLLLSTEIYDFQDGDYRLISTPAILVGDNEPAAIELNTHGSGRLTLGFRSDF
jgi:transcriptional regulator with XRE-family HTH domain